MKISAIHSRLGGFEHIQVHKQRLWAELIDAIETTSFERAFANDPAGSTAALGVYLRNVLISRGWHSLETTYLANKDTVLQTNLPPKDASYLKSSFSPDLVRDRLAIEVVFESFGIDHHFLTHAAFYADDLIDAGIEILPTEQLVEELAGGSAYYEAELDHLLRHGRSVPVVPLVLIGVAP